MQKLGNLRTQVSRDLTNRLFNYSYQQVYDALIKIGELRTYTTL